jgi:hypothetical protein
MLINKKKKVRQPGAMAHAYNPKEDCEFKYSLGYIARPCLKQTKKNNKIL